MIFSVAYSSTTPSSGGSAGESCTWNNGASKDKVCQVELDKIETCNKANSFGYEKGEPCILIKLNRVSSCIKINLNVLRLQSLFSFCVIDLQLETRSIQSWRHFPLGHA